MAYQPKSYKKFVATAATATLVATAVVPAAFANEAETAAFTDVPKSYEAAIDFVVSNNISNGLTETQYGISKEIKRGDAAILIANAAGLNDKDAKASGFSDVPTRGALQINSLKAKGIVDGKSTTKFGFEDPITRGEAAIMLQRAFKLTGDVNNVKFTDVSDRYEEAVAALLAYGVTNGTSDTKYGTQNPIKRGDFAKFIYALKDLVVLPTTDPAVTALNAKQIELNFGKAVDPSTVLDKNGTLKNGVLSFATISGKSAVINDDSVASLSKDGKTLTVSTTSGTLEGEYVLKTVEDTIKDTSGKYLPAYTSNVFTAKDMTAPTVASVEKLNASNVRVNFSEPLASAGNWTFTFANGTTASVTPDTSTLASGYVDLAIDPGVKAGEIINATILGAADYAGNLVSPNPVTINFSKGALDGVAPTVQSITSIGLNKFEIKFSELVQNLSESDITVNGNARTPNDSNVAVTGTEAIITQDTTDKTKYTVEIAPLAAGLHTIGLIEDAVTDMSGEESAATSKVVEFKADAVAPTLVKSEVKTEDGVEYLYLTFSESVEEGTVNALTASQVKDYVTVNGKINLSNLNPVANTDNTQHRVALSEIAFTPEGGSPSTISTGATYTVELNGFTDASRNALKATSISFTRASDSDLNKPEILKNDVESAPYTSGNGVDVINNDTVRLTFNKDLDGASAVNKANYSVNGIAVDSATLLPGNIVELKLSANANNLSGLRNVSVSGVKSKAGVVMSPFTTTEYFVENVRPTFTAAFSAANEITLTFSENVVNVIDSSNGEVANDFKVNVDGVDVTGFNPAVVVNEKGTDGTKVYTLTLDRTLTPAEYAKTITITPTQANNVADVNTNKLTFTSVTVSK